MPLLSARSISKVFDQHEVLSDVSLEVGKGEWVAILGESGSGKSTLLRILGRFIDQDSGEVALNRQKLAPVHQQLIAGTDEIRLVHQEFDLFPNQTVRENIAYPLRFHSTEFRQSRTQELLEITQLQQVADQKAKLLSGGEKQRTAIAKAIAEVPLVLLMDEPFAHLDIPNRQRLSTVLSRLKMKEKLTCLFVTHDTTDAMAWSDRVTVLHKGKVIQTDRPQALYEHPGDAYVAELTGNLNWLDAKHSRFIRPEKVHITQTQSRARFSGKVTAVRFRGRDWEYECSGKGKQSFIFYRNNDKIRIGDEIHLTYAARDEVSLGV